MSNPGKNIAIPAKNGLENKSTENHNDGKTYISTETQAFYNRSFYEYEKAINAIISAIEPTGKKKSRNLSLQEVKELKTHLDAAHKILDTFPEQLLDLINKINFLDLRSNEQYKLRNQNVIEIYYDIGLPLLSEVEIEKYKPRNPPQGFEKMVHSILQNISIRSETWAGLPFVKFKQLCKEQVPSDSNFIYIGYGEGRGSIFSQKKKCTAFSCTKIDPYILLSNNGVYKEFGSDAHSSFLSRAATHEMIHYLFDLMDFHELKFTEHGADFLELAFADPLLVCKSTMPYLTDIKEFLPPSLPCLEKISEEEYAITYNWCKLPGTLDVQLAKNSLAQLSQGEKNIYLAGAGVALLLGGYLLKHIFGRLKKAKAKQNKIKSDSFNLEVGREDKEARSYVVSSEKTKSIKAESPQKTLTGKTLTGETFDFFKENIIRKLPKLPTKNKSVVETKCKV